MSGTRPHVSVVIPVYNGANFLKEAVESVFAQTYADYEVVIVDDGSKDETPEVVKSFGDRVRYFRKPNGGVATALNRGVKEMRGEWFAWLSHDDLWFPTKLQRQIDTLQQNPALRACYTDYRVINATGSTLREIRTPWYPRAVALRQLFASIYMGGSTMLVARSCFDELGPFDEALRTTQDGEMWLRIQRKHEIARVPQILAAERVHGAQDSQRVPSHENEKASTLERVFLSLDPLELFPELSSATATQRTIRAQIWFAETMAVRGFDALARKYLEQAVAADPAWTNPARLSLLSMLTRKALRPISSRARKLLARQ